MATLPILLKNPQILLLGGGSVAYQKAKVLKENQISFTVIALDYKPQFVDLQLDSLTKSVTASDLAKYNIIIDATGNDDVGLLLQDEKLRRFVLINRVDQPDQSDFYFSSLLNYGSLKIAVSTDGASPTIGQVVRDKISSIIPDDIGDLVAEAQQQRQNGKIDVDATRVKIIAKFN